MWGEEGDVKKLPSFLLTTKHNNGLILFGNYDKMKYTSMEEIRVVDSKIKELRMVFNKWKGELG